MKQYILPALLVLSVALSPAYAKNKPQGANQAPTMQQVVDAETSKTAAEAAKKGAADASAAAQKAKEDTTKAAETAEFGVPDFGTQATEAQIAGIMKAADDLMAQGVNAGRAKNPGGAKVFFDQAKAKYADAAAKYRASIAAYKASKADYDVFYTKYILPMLTSEKEMNQAKAAADTAKEAAQKRLGDKFVERPDIKNDIGYAAYAEGMGNTAKTGSKNHVAYSAQYSKRDLCVSAKNQFESAKRTYIKLQEKYDALK